MLEVRGRGRMESIKLDYTNVTDVVTEEALSRLQAEVEQALID